MVYMKYARSQIELSQTTGHIVLMPSLIWNNLLLWLKMFNITYYFHMTKTQYYIYNQWKSSHKRTQENNQKIIVNACMLYWRAFELVHSADLACTQFFSSHHEQSGVCNHSLSQEILNCIAFLNVFKQIHVNSVLSKL